MPRFVILRHEMPADAKRATHWDLLLERGETLESWALSREPAQSGLPMEVAAEKLADHRLAYLTYEGPISGDRGSVSRWDEGDFRELGPQRLELHGAKLACLLELRLIDQRWIACFTPLEASLTRDST